eukprot:IDg14854t1
MLTSSPVGGTRMIESLPNLYKKKMKENTNGIIEIRPHVPFMRKRSPRLLVDDIALSSLSPEIQRNVRDMLRLFSSMWQGHFGDVTATEHRIDLLPGARPQFLQT